MKNIKTGFWDELTYDQKSKLVTTLGFLFLILAIGATLIASMVL